MSAPADHNVLNVRNVRERTPAPESPPVENSTPPAPLHPIGTLREQTERERLAIKIKKLARSAVRQARFTDGISLPTVETIGKHFDDHCRAGHIDIDAATREREIVEALRASFQ